MIEKMRSIIKRLPLIAQINRLRLRRIYQSMPPVINLELTTKCNARCRMCPHPDLDFDKKIMSEDALDKVLDGLEGAVSPGTIIYPVGLGEPLLIPTLYEMNRRIANKFPQARIHYNTNGILLANKRADAFLDYAHQVVISLNSPDKDSYEKLMRVDKYDEVVKGMMVFLDKRRTHQRFLKDGMPQIKLQMMGLDAYKDNFNGFAETWRPLLEPSDVVYFNPMDNWGGRIPDKSLYTRQDTKRYPCGSPFRMVSVNVEGDVFPCCVPFGTRKGESIHLGNIMNKPLTEILDNGKLDHIKKLHLEGKDQTLDACRGCDVYRVDPNIRFKNPFTGHWI